MYQKITIIGNLGRDPEMRYIPSGQAVTNMSVATNRKWTKDGEKQEETVWFRVSVWGAQAESCNQYLKSGSKVLVEGRMKSPEVYEVDGEHRCSLEMTAQNVLFLSPKEETNDDPGF